MKRVKRFLARGYVVFTEYIQPQFVYGFDERFSHKHVALTCPTEFREIESRQLGNETFSLIYG